MNLNIFDAIDSIELASFQGVLFVVVSLLTLGVISVAWFKEIKLKRTVMHHVFNAFRVALFTVWPILLFTVTTIAISKNLNSELKHHT